MILPSYAVSVAKVMGPTSTLVSCCRSKQLNSYPFVDDHVECIGANRDTLEYEEMDDNKNR